MVVAGVALLAAWLGGVILGFSAAARLDGLRGVDISAVVPVSLAALLALGGGLPSKALSLAAAAATTVIAARLGAGFAAVGLGVAVGYGVSVARRPR